MSSEENARNISNENIPSGQEALDLAHERPKMMPNARWDISKTWKVLNFWFLWEATYTQYEL